MQFNREPRLSDFYKPSNEMKEWQKLIIGALGLGGGYLIHKLV